MLPQRGPFSVLGEAYTNASETSPSSCAVCLNRKPGGHNATCSACGQSHGYYRLSNVFYHGVVTAVRVQTCRK
eukprot:4605169-Amphidinium_carterae.1